MGLVSFFIFNYRNTSKETVSAPFIAFCLFTPSFEWHDADTTPVPEWWNCSAQNEAEKLWFLIEQFVAIITSVSFPSLDEKWLWCQDRRDPSHESHYFPCSALYKYESFLFFQNKVSPTGVATEIKEAVVLDELGRLWVVDSTGI